LNTRHMGIHKKVIASVLAGAMSLGYGGGASLVQVAMAQTAPAATAPKAAAPAAAAKDAAPKPSAADLKKAKTAYADGEKKFKAGDFAGALEQFQTADSIQPTPQSARYIGQCQEKLSKYPEAVAAYERFLAGATPKQQKQIDETKASVDKIKAMPGKVHIESNPPGATVAVGDKPAAPTPADVELAPGKYTLKFDLEGYVPKEQEVEVAYASTSTVKPDLEKKPEPPPPPPAPAPVAEEPPPAPPPPPPAEPRSLVPAYVTGGLALVAVGVGTGFGIAALNTQSDYKDQPTTEKADRGENQALIADMSFGIAATLAVTSLVLFLTNDDSGAPKAATTSSTTVATAKKKSDGVSFSAAPVFSKNGGGAGAMLRF
jgi:tetratricopeptide (TPR) repeat protein